MLAPDGQLWVTHCAWCRRVQTADGQWHHPPAGLKMDTAMHTHGICAGCAVLWHPAPPTQAATDC